MSADELFGAVTDEEEAEAAEHPIMQAMKRPNVSLIDLLKRAFPDQRDFDAAHGVDSDWLAGN